MVRAVADREPDRSRRGNDESNRCWLITPWHTLQLVHAVQQPLKEPVCDQLEANRDSARPSPTCSGSCGSIRQARRRSIARRVGRGRGRPGPAGSRATARSCGRVRAADADGSDRADGRRSTSDPYSLCGGRHLTFSTGRLNDLVVSPLLVISSATRSTAECATRSRQPPRFASISRRPGARSRSSSVGPATASSSISRQARPRRAAGPLRRTDPGLGAERERRR